MFCILHHASRSQLQIKFTCARTKCEVIVSNVFAPWAASLVTQDLEQVQYVFLSIDVSNHVKFLPAVIRYLKIYDGSISVETKLLDLIELEGVTAEEIAAEGLVVI